MTGGAEKSRENLHSFGEEKSLLTPNFLDRNKYECVSSNGYHFLKRNLFNIFPVFIM
jgi:hypothetical protein